MEIVDILTDTGTRTGRTKPKEAVHRDGDWHLAAHLWIVRSDGHVLLQRRSPLKVSWPDLWDISVAGHVSSGETAMDAVLREAHEELGLTFSPPELRHLGRLRYQAVVNDGAYIENEFHEVYLALRDLEPASLRLDPMEVAEVRFVPPDELDRYDLVPHPEEYALLRANLSRTKT